MAKKKPWPPRSWNLFLDESAGDVRRLSHVDRFSSIPVLFRENTAEHTSWVVLYGLMIHSEVGGPAAAAGPIAMAAGTHDLEECVTGDVVRTFKYSSEEFKRAVQAASDAMVEKLPKSVLDVHKLAQSMSGEGTWEHGWYVKAVVKAADFLSLYHYMWREERSGNKGILPFVKRMNEDLEAMRSLTLYDSQKARGKDRKELSLRLSELYKSMSKRAPEPTYFGV
jgi:5'-deoxynucleotidase YfbR-like HD superfamily hydrolase